MTLEGSMQSYTAYVTELTRLADQLRTTREEDGVRDAVAASLDGQPGSRLRELVPLHSLRSSGAFFTGSVLATHAASKFCNTLNENSVIFDPACGAGDLLIACAHALPTKGRLGETLRKWGRQLLGKDLHGEFVSATRLRLAILAMSRGASGSPARMPDLARSLSGVNVGCGRAAGNHVAAATHVIMNPPFTSVSVQQGCKWRTGLVNEAALFVEDVINAARVGTRIVAILPDVLRSGQGYRKWRAMVDSHCRTESVELWGRFARWADVDVFVWSATKVRSQDSKDEGLEASWSLDLTVGPTVGDRFNVSVGPVVPFRDPKSGPWTGFLHPGNAPAWGELDQVPESRRTRARLVQPPFVAVRRTSRPGDKHRAVGTIVRGEYPVAVENHLLSVVPLSRTVRDCRRLLLSLRDVRSTQWLDRRIRCRHLTVTALRALPLWGDSWAL